MRDVIVGVDRSEHAHRTATTAAELAAALRANLHVVTCIDRTRLDSLHEANQFLVDLSAALRCDSITHSVLVGNAAKMLGEEVQRLDARVIVVGSCHDQGDAEALGSVATDVVKNATCDVLIATAH